MARSTSTWRIPAVLWRALRHMTFAPEAIARHAGLPAAAAGRHDHEFNTDQMFSFWRAVEAMADDPLLGFKLLKAASKVGTDTTFLAATRSATFRAGLDSYIRSRRLHSPARVLIDDAGDTVRYTRHVPGAVLPEPAVAIDFTLGTMLNLGRVGTGRTIDPVRVELTRTGPRLPFHRTFFGCPIVYGAPRNALTFRAVDLALPLLSHDPEAVDALTASIDASIVQRAAAEAIDAAVESAIRQVITSGRRPELANVAQQLGISRRSLQRRIAEDGSTFRALLAEVRREMAKSLLSQSSTRIDAVAHQLHYADTASFHRAFRAWEGVAPTQWRNAAAAATTRSAASPP